MRMSIFLKKLYTCERDGGLWGAINLSVKLKYNIIRSRYKVIFNFLGIYVFDWYLWGALFGGNYIKLWLLGFLLADNQ